jgi:ubiquinol-cytochrome c reductase cytochrome b subunit
VVKGPTWWHTSALGHFVNSTHLWSVELFFMFMVIHLWAKFFMAAWRGRRALTWMTGVAAFLGSIGTAFTGYLSQTNFDSQWISTQAKDGLNSVGIGAEFNVLNTGQMLLWHVTLLPLVVGVVVALHVLLVRRHGVVPPFDARPGSSVPGQQSSAEPAPEIGSERVGVRDVEVDS